MTRARAVGAIVAVSGLLSPVACSDGGGPSAPRTGAIAVTSTVRTTSDNASFSYSITVDQGTPQTVSAAAPARIVIPGVSVGQHSVTLSGLAAGCTIGSAPSDSRVVTIRGGDTVSVAFDVGCVRTTGDIAVTLSLIHI